MKKEREIRQIDHPLPTKSIRVKSREGARPTIAGIEHLLRAVQGVLGLGLPDAVHLEADGAEGVDVHDPAAVEDEGRLGHGVVDALVVQRLELVPGGGNTKQQP